MLAYYNFAMALLVCLMAFFVCYTGQTHDDDAEDYTVYASVWNFEQQGTLVLFSLPINLEVPLVLRHRFVTVDGQANLGTGLYKERLCLTSHGNW